MTEVSGVKDPGKRKALKYAGVAAGAAILGRVTAGIGIPRAQTPEEAAEEARKKALADQAEQKRQLELREKFEATRQLDVFPSKPSQGEAVSDSLMETEHFSWTVRYPETDKNSSYAPVEVNGFSYGTHANKDSKSDYDFYPEVMLDGKRTGFRAEPYTTLKGDRAIILSSRGANPLLPSADSWLLRPESQKIEEGKGPAIDSRVVIFEDPKTKETHYTQLKLVEPIRNQQLPRAQMIKIVEMQPQPATT